MGRDTTPSIHSADAPNVVHGVELRHIDLFSGIGGFALAARANGIRTVLFCEIDQRCRDFLGRAWPGVRVHDDIRTLSLGDATQAPGDDDRRERVSEQAIPEPRDTTQRIYLLTAGVPCQPASRAGKQRGASDDRWLWPEAVRVLSEARPTWALLENPPGIGDVGLAGILADLEAQGYAVSIVAIPACAVGAPHQRMRYWIICRRNADADQARPQVAAAAPRAHGLCAEHRQEELADDESLRCQRRRAAPGQENRTLAADSGRGHWDSYVWLPCADGKFRRAPDDSFGLVDGLHQSVLGALGNSIIPQVAERIIAAMVEADNE